MLSPWTMEQYAYDIGDHQTISELEETIKFPLSSLCFNLRRDQQARGCSKSSDKAELNSVKYAFRLLYVLESSS